MKELVGCSADHALSMSAQHVADTGDDGRVPVLHSVEGSIWKNIEQKRIRTVVIFRQSTENAFFLEYYGLAHSPELSSLRGGARVVERHSERGIFDLPFGQIVNA